MLSRATQNSETKRRIEPTLTKGPLVKQSPVSSNPKPSLTPNGDIIQQLNKASSRSSRLAPGALSPRPLNSPSRLNGTLNGSTQSRVKQPNSRKSLASLYHKPDSFHEYTEIISLLDEESAPYGPGNTVSSVYIAEGDLSDDDNLDLDFQRPTALPAVLTDARPALESDSLGPSASSTSVLSWSQSSPSHYLSPAARQPARAAPQVTGKRESVKIESDSPPPAAKKRSLPGPWRSSKETLADSGSTASEPALHVTTPAPRKTDSHPWNATPSAVEAQKKQLRRLQKKSASSASEVSADENPAAISAHVTNTPSKSSAVSLSNEQRHVKSLVCDRNQSVFFTGPAGTGKSVLMRAIIQELKKKWSKDPDRLAVTASTGLAACNIGGMTLHSFAGIGLGKEDAQALVKKIRRNPKAKNRWLRTKILIIDEISMVDGDLFDKLSQIGRVIRNNGRPWGGIQLVITGDFFQLPPVPDAEKRDIKFAFEAATWNTSIDHTIGLTEVFRQKDPEFADMLNEMRLGRISDRTVQNFKALSRPVHFNDGLEVTELFPTRTEVDSSNERRLRALGTKTYRYDAIDTGDPVHREKLLQNMMAPKFLELKKGAQVMLIKNMDDTLVNGSLGTVVRFMSEGDGYISGCDEEGPDGGGIDQSVKQRIKAFSRQLEASDMQDSKQYPLVLFHAVDGTPRHLLCVPEEWKSELPTGEIQASRKQIPLILAWALSIHKAQGQTLERVKVDLGKVFEKGQAYVALSRATSQEGLQVLRFEKHKVMAHPRVIQFYNRLYSAETAVSKRNTDPSVSSHVIARPENSRRSIDTGGEGGAMTATG